MPKLSREASKSAKRTRVHTEMGKFKRGQLHSGSKRGPVVKDRKQAIAISLSEAGLSRKGRGRKVGHKRSRKRVGRK